MSERTRHSLADGTDPANPNPQSSVRQLEDELQAARQKIETANRSHWEFLVTMNQELRNPMTAIMGMTDLTLLTELSDEQREYLATVKQAAHSLMRLLNNVLDYAKLQSGTLALEFSGFSFRRCVHDALRRMAPDAHHKGLEIMGRIAPEIPDLLVADPRRLGEVIDHIVGNSIKFTRQGEVSLDVQLESHNDKEVSLRFNIADTGIGIPAEDQRRIFAPFSQIQDAATRSYGGAGLGLPIAAALVGMMGGHIKVQSLAGRGSTFEFAVRLLKQQAGAETRPIELNPPQQQTISGRRLLIIDDNDRSRRWLGEIAARWSMDVQLAATAQSALEQVEARKGEPLDLVLFDSSLANVGNFSLAADLDQLAEKQPAKILMLSSTERLPDGVQCRALGIAASLVKPIFEDELRDAVLLALGRTAAAVEVGTSSLDEPVSAPAPCCEPLAALARLGGDRELYADVVGRLINEGDAALAKIDAALQAGDGDQLHRAAHSLKGLAAMCGATALVDAAAELEQLGRSRRLEAAPAAYAALEQAAARTREELASFA